MQSVIEEGIVAGPTFSVAPSENVILCYCNTQIVASEIRLGEDE